MVVTRTSLLKGPMTSPAYTPPFARTFSARYAADLDTHTVGRDMIELAQEGSEEGFHFVCGAVWALERVASQLTEASRRDILAALYEDQGLDRLEAPSDIQ
jgi:hypothetical protein